MYILRHPKDGSAPLGISRAPGGEGLLTSLSTDNTSGTLLRDGSDCIVLHVSKAPVDLLVTAFLTRATDPVPKLRLDQIGLDAVAAQPAAVPSTPPAAPLPAPVGRGPIQIGPHGITLIGHIERSGDMVAAPGNHLGDPNTNLRLEGFQAMWPDHPDDVDLAYGVAIEGHGHMPVVKTGKFCGSKNEARRITEVTFALVGAGAARLQLEGTAYFSGGYQVPVASGTPLSGPSGLEHLTAISLRAVPATAPQAKQNPWSESSRTKIFKADSRQVPSGTQGKSAGNIAVTTGIPKPA